MIYIYTEGKVIYIYTYIHYMINERYINIKMTYTIKGCKFSNKLTSKSA